MTAAELIELAKAFAAVDGCDTCVALNCKGWESMPGGIDRASLRCVGTLRDPDDEEPTIAEYHPAGTHGSSIDAPIALGWFSYNRCDVWLCVDCGRPFLRYTEYGGYYTDERVREVQADLVHQA
jgi:hypothetical protein